MTSPNRAGGGGGAWDFLLFPKREELPPDDELLLELNASVEEEEEILGAEAAMSGYSDEEIGPDEDDFLTTGAGENKLEE